MTEEYFVVVHRKNPPSWREAKFIGVFSKQSKAEGVIRELVSKAGFSEFPDGFDVVGFGDGVIASLPEEFCANEGRDDSK